MKARDNLIWIDLEMTGLDPDNDKIIEIATIVTDKHLNVLAEGPSLIIHQADSVLDGMDSWNTRQHNQSGLVSRVKASQLTEAIAEEQTLIFLEKHVDAGKSPMCGNTICQDRRFLYRYMPKLEKFFHYRHLDVSTVKTLASYWAPQVAEGLPKKESQHLALEDIKDSINEMRYYRDNFIKLPPVETKTAE